MTEGGCRSVVVAREDVSSTDHRFDVPGAVVYAEQRSLNVLLPLARTSCGVWRETETPVEIEDALVDCFLSVPLGFEIECRINVERTEAERRSPPSFRDFFFDRFHEVRGPVLDPSLRVQM